MLDAVQWRYRPLITIQLAIRNISRAEADLQKTMKKGWFSRKEKLQAEDKIRQTGGEEPAGDQQEGDEGAEDVD